MIAKSTPPLRMTLAFENFTDQDFTIALHKKLDNAWQQMSEQVIPSSNQYMTLLSSLHTSNIRIVSSQSQRSLDDRVIQYQEGRYIFSLTKEGKITNKES